MGIPKEVYLDKGSEFKSDFDRFCKQQDIILTTTNIHARFAERFIRWVKLQLFRRKDLFAKTSWTTQMVDITNKWNSMDHKAINMSAKEAHNDKNALDVKVGLMLKSKHKRSYPDLARGDEVRLRVKKSSLTRKPSLVGLMRFTRWTQYTWTLVEQPTACRTVRVTLCLGSSCDMNCSRLVSSKIVS